MTTAVHTPGPWKAYKQDNGDWYISRSLGAQLADTALATVHAWAQTEDEANARLITAAPELLEALEKIVTLIDDEREIAHQAAFRFGQTVERVLSERLNTPALAKARTTLARAKGGAI